MLLQCSMVMLSTCSYNREISFNWLNTVLFGSFCIKPFHSEVAESYLYGVLVYTYIDIKLRVWLEAGAAVCQTASLWVDLHSLRHCCTCGLRQPAGRAAALWPQPEKTSSIVASQLGSGLSKGGGRRLYSLTHIPLCDHRHSVGQSVQ